MKLFLFQVLQKIDESFTLRGLDESFVERTPGDKYVCDICDYHTVHKSNLTRHQNCSISYATCVARDTNPAMAYPYTLKVYMKTLSNMNVQCATSNRTRFGTIRATLPNMILRYKKSALLARQHFNIENHFCAINARNLPSPAPQQ